MIGRTISGIMSIIGWAMILISWVCAVNFIPTAIQWYRDGDLPRAIYWLLFAMLIFKIFPTTLLNTSKESGE